MDNILLSSKRQDWETPPEFFKKLNSEFNFTLDPCASPETAKCKKYYTIAENGLEQNWSGETVFCNPPYGRELPKWIKKCAEESKHATVVMLIPARTDTIAFHEYIYNKAEIRFIRGRLKFLVNGIKRDNSTFPTMIVIFRNNTKSGG